MSSLASITRTQWIILIILELVGVCIYWGVIPWLVLSSNAAPAPTPSLSAELLIVETALPALTPTILPSPTSRPVAAAPTSTPNRTPTGTSTPTAIPSSTSTVTPVPTETSAPTPKPPAARIAPSALVDLALNPRAMLTSKTSIFTSACFGEGANPLQDRDFMAPADWSGSPGRKCIFGFAVNPNDHLPTGRYTAGGGPDGQPRFYLIPPEVFAKDTQSIKILSQLHVIVDPEQGCDALGYIGTTADGLNYQCSACEFLKSGGVCPIMDGGAKSIVLPLNQNNLIDPSSSGGTYGFQGFPVVIFRKGFSLYFTGRSGYAPPRTWFESTVDTLASNVNVKTTAEMTNSEVNGIAAQFDRSLSGTDPTSQLASFERPAQVTSVSPIAVKSKQEATISFAATPGTVLSSITWRITPQNNQDKMQFLEANLCLIINGEEFCFTGVEDFAHCAFYTPCVTGYSRLAPIDHGGYLATRYFPAGTAPVIRDGKVTVRFQAPDIGTVLEMEVTVRVRDVDPALVSAAYSP